MFYCTINKENSLHVLLPSSGIPKQLTNILAYMAKDATDQLKRSGNRYIILHLKNKFVTHDAYLSLIYRMLHGTEK